MSYISTEDLTHEFNIRDATGNIMAKKRACDGVNVHVEKGAFVAILGRNGSGKSTFARHLNGLLMATEGSVYIADEKVEDKNLIDIRRKLGMVFQNPDNQIVGNSVKEDVAFGLENLGLPSKEIWARIYETLKITGMGAYIDRNVARLSGGQKQRLAITSVCAMKPETIVLDEATSMLDPEASKNILDSVLELNKKYGITIIMITHRIEEAVLADYIYVMGAGKVRLEGVTGHVITRVKELETLGLEAPLYEKIKYELGFTGNDKELISYIKEKAGRSSSEEAGSSRKNQIEDNDGRILNLSYESDVDKEDNLISETNIDRKNDNPISEKDISRKDDILIWAKDVRYIYNNGDSTLQAVKGVSFQIKKGEIVAIAGHTGSGKTTLIQMFNGLLRPTSGELVVAGTDIAKVKDLKQLRKGIGYVFQYPEYQLFEASVLKDVKYGPVNFGFSEQEADGLARDALKLVSIGEEMYEMSPFDLSGGQKKRVALAGILAYKPELLILDEPVAGLDPESKRELFALIRRLNREEGTTIIFVSHDMKDVYEMAPRTIVLNEGEIAYDGDTGEMFRNDKLVRANHLAVPELVSFKQKLEPEIDIRENTIAGVVEKLKEHL